MIRKRRALSSAGGGRYALRGLRSRNEPADLYGQVVRVSNTQYRKGDDCQINANVGSGFCDKQAVYTASQESHKGCEYQCDLSSVEISSSHDDQCVPCRSHAALRETFEECREVFSIIEIIAVSFQFYNTTLMTSPRHKSQIRWKCVEYPKAHARRYHSWSFFRESCCQTRF